MIFLSSHTDHLKSKEEEVKKCEVMHSLISTPAFTSFHYAGLIPINCRSPESTSMSQLRQQLGKSCETLRIKTTMNFNCHCLLLFLLDQFRDTPAVQLKDVLAKVNESWQVTSEDARKLSTFIPDDFPRLFKLCEELNKRGSILILKNSESPENSWVILDQQFLLTQMTGTVFAPNTDEFKRCHRDLATNTGVVPCMYTFLQV